MKLKELKPLITLFFGQAKCLKDTTRIKFQAEYKLTQWISRQVLPGSKWKKFQDEWLREQIGRAIDEALSVAPFRERFTVELVLRRLRCIGVGHVLFNRLAGKEWRKRRMTLPTLQEKALTCIKDIVASRIPLEKMTVGLITL